MTKLGRKNSLNIDIIENYNQLSEFHKNAVLFTFESNSLDDLVSPSNKKHAVRKFILDIILWLRKQEEEQSFDFGLIEQL